MRQRVPMLLVALALAIPAVACEDDDPVDPADTYDLTFTGDASFQTAHGGQAIEVAVVESGGTVVATDDGTVASSGTESFSFSFADALEEGETYEIHYWIDSNFGGGTAGTCDPPANDHQWSVDVAAPTQDVILTDSHRPAETEDVCSTF